MGQSVLHNNPLILPVPWPLFRICAFVSVIFDPEDVAAFLKVSTFQNQHGQPKKSDNSYMLLAP